MSKSKYINVYTKDFHAYGEFRWSEFEEDYGWNLVQWSVESGHGSEGEVKEALFGQLDKELELELDDREWGIL